MAVDVAVTDGFYGDMEVQKDGLSESELDKLVILIEQAFNNHRCIRGNPASTEWPLIIKSMNAIFKKEFELDKVKNKWKKHRKKWRKFNEILNYSGVGWNSRECTIDASEEFWADIRKNKKGYRICQKTSFKHYEVMTKICGNSREDGEFAVGAGAGESEEVSIVGDGMQNSHAARASVGPSSKAACSSGSRKRSRDSSKTFLVGTDQHRIGWLG